MSPCPPHTTLWSFCIVSSTKWSCKLDSSKSSHRSENRRYSATIAHYVRLWMWRWFQFHFLNQNFVWILVTRPTGFPNLIPRSKRAGINPISSDPNRKPQYFPVKNRQIPAQSSCSWSLQYKRENEYAISNKTNYLALKTRLKNTR
jgi:hypothetical protein